MESNNFSCEIGSSQHEEEEEEFESELLEDTEDETLETDVTTDLSNRIAKLEAAVEITEDKTAAVQNNLDRMKTTAVGPEDVSVREFRKLYQALCDLARMPCYVSSAPQQDRDHMIAVARRAHDVFIYIPDATSCLAWCRYMQKFLVKEVVNNMQGLRQELIETEAAVSAGTDCQILSFTNSVYKALLFEVRMRLQEMDQ